jgi:hypothetical protein
LQEVAESADDTVKVGADVAVHSKEVSATPSMRVERLPARRAYTVGLVAVFYQDGPAGDIYLMKACLETFPAFAGAVIVLHAIEAGLAHQGDVSNVA